MTAERPTVGKAPTSGSGYYGITSVQRRSTNLVLQRRTGTGLLAAGKEKTRQGLTLLYSPLEPLIDFVFVHGLGGGSMKTWRKHDDPSYFWPEAWIPLDSDLSHVRTSTFGYPSNWAERNDSVLSVHDFGRKLLGDLVTSPFLRKDSRTSIVLIGHSMGGLVMKKAYLLARQESRDIANRIRYMFFFATPHRGSDSAELLKNLLDIATLDRPYLGELQKNSPSLQVINDEFRYCADDLGLFSFYETKKTSFGVKSEMLVSKDSAVMGYKNEDSQFLNADHRGVCKFESPEDPNYITVRNALVAVAEDLLNAVISDKDDEKWKQIGVLQSYLNVFDVPESDLMEQQDFKTVGSCKWMEDRAGFQKWRDLEDMLSAERSVDGSAQPGPNQGLQAKVERCHLYWLSAKPATGKTVCAAHVIGHLQSRGLDCSYFFFKFGNRAKQTLSSLFRSLAYHMSIFHPSIRQSLHLMQSHGNNFDKDDEGAIWRKVFVNVVFRTRLDRPQYWVIDALDECLLNEKLFNFLKNLDVGFDLRIFVTSRPTPEIDRSFSRLALPVTVDRITRADTDTDMRLYLNTEQENLPVHTAEERASLMNTMLSKSAGCFLWMRLVQRELQDIYSEDSIADVLKEIPAEMSDLYKRSIEVISKNVREKRLIKALLTWTVCSIRPLTLNELQVALKYDDGLQVRELRKSIEGLCANLLYVDSGARVQLIHSTARDYLLDKNLDSELAIRREAGHERLASTCLKFIHDEMRPPRSRSLRSHSGLKKQERPLLADYASTAFSEHVSASSSTSDALLVALTRFLQVNVLAWIEYVASEKRNLYILMRTAKNFKKYLERGAKYVSPLGPEVATIESWSTDLIRLVTKFGKNLINCPNSIFVLIPSIAPSESRLHQQSLSGPRWLEVNGSVASSWDDCVAIIDYKESWATAIACGDNVFAIGLKNGLITIYDQSTCQERGAVLHRVTDESENNNAAATSNRPAPVKLLAFDTSSQRLASASPQSICVWSLAGDLLQMFSIKEPCVTIAFALGHDALITVSRASRVLFWSLDETDEDHLLPKFRRLSSGSVNSSVNVVPRQAPLAAAISPDQTMLALLYRGRPVYLWSLQDNTLLGLCGRDLATKTSNISVLTALFNPNVESGLLVIAYQDGELALYDAWAQTGLISVDGNAYTLAATPDGRTLGTGDTRGTIQIWDFETLTLLYRIRSGLDEVRHLAFSGDGSRLVDIRDSKTKIWEPSALIRRTVEEDASVSDALTPEAQTVGENEDEVEITAAISARDMELVFAGRSDGSIVAHDARSGRILTTLYRHGADLVITAIDYRSGIIASADVGGTILVRTVSVTPGRGASATPLLEQQLSEPVQQLLVDQASSQIVVSTGSGDSAWSLSSHIGSPVHRWSLEKTGMHRRWMQVADGNLAIYCEDQVRLYDRMSYGICGCYLLPRHQSLGSGTEFSVIRALTTDEAQKHMIAAFCRSVDDNSAAHVVTWIAPFETAEAQLPTVHTKPILDLSSKQVKTFLGVNGSSIVFLDQELWVCSVDLDEIQVDVSSAIRRHFFVSPDWIGSQRNANALLTQAGDVVFAKYAELAIIKGGLDWSYG